ncbi:MAG: diguanylate cyclase domain-containing protein [Leptospirillia bacterium]
MSGLPQKTLPFVPPPILPASFRLKLPFRSARELVVTTAWVSEHTSLERVYRLFGSDPSLPGLAILRDRRPLGLLTKNALVERFSYRFSHELFGTKAVAAFMDPAPIVIEAETSLDTIEKKLGESGSGDMTENGFLIVEEGRYLGIGTWQELVRKISSRREEVFSFMAHHDGLTGLPNRLSFMRDLEGRLLRGEAGAVIYFDLNGFKEVNDRHGHEEGDALLTRFAERLEGALPPGSLAARLGGDEFAVLLPVPPAVSDGSVRLFLEELKDSLARPCSVGGQPYVISASAGFVHFPVPLLDLKGILRMADSRMYEEKKKRRRASAAAFVPASGASSAGISASCSLDSLTGLPDRQALYVTLEERFRSGSGVLLLLLDLDHFSRINDLFGHKLGDSVLRETALRLRGTVRESDFVARIGGDEFAVVMPGVQCFDEARRAAEGIESLLSAPFVLPEREYILSASIGVASSSPKIGDFHEVLGNADMALMEAKEAGRSRSHFFDPREKQRRAERYGMAQDLYRALSREEFRLWYQPIVETEGGRLMGAEALLRWTREDGRVVGPDLFVPLLEENGLIVPLGEWILETALRDRKGWEAADGTKLFVSVNVSGVQLSRPDFLSRFLQILDRGNAEPGELSLELTETVAMKDPSGAEGILSAFRERGVHIALDDFGTGLSSLARLCHFPADLLKIDRSFVRQVFERPEEAEIVRTLVMLARRLSLGLCAEGVEREEDREFLSGLGVEWIQGYLASRPMPEEAFSRMVKEGQRLFGSVSSGMGSP